MINCESLSVPDHFSTESDKLDDYHVMSRDHHPLAQYCTMIPKPLAPHVFSDAKPCECPSFVAMLLWCTVVSVVARTVVGARDPGM